MDERHLPALCFGDLYSNRLAIRAGATPSACRRTGWGYLLIDISSLTQAAKEIPQ